MIPLSMPVPMLMLILNIIPSLLWHRFCLKIANRTQMVRSGQSYKLPFFVFITILIRFGYHYTGRMQIGNYVLNVLSLLVGYLYAICAMKLDRRIVFCFLVLFHLLDVICEYIYTFIILIVLQIATPESISQMRHFEIIFLLLVNTGAAFLMYILSRLDYKYLEAMKEECIYYLFLAILAWDYGVFFFFSLSIPERSEQIFNQGTLAVMIGEMVFLGIILVIIMLYVNKQREIEENYHCALTKLELLEQLHVNHEKTKRIVHDMQNHFASIGYLLDCDMTGHAKDYVEQLAPQVEEASRIENGDNIIAVLLYRKKAEAKWSGVEMEYTVHVQGVKLPIVDLSTILFNMCDNSIEYCNKHGLGNSGVQYRVFVMDGELIFECYNKILEKNVFDKEGNIVTDKEDKEYHGYGLAILSEYAQKYKGTVYIEQEYGLFIIQIRLPEYYAITHETGTAIDSPPVKGGDTL